MKNRSSINVPIIIIVIFAGAVFCLFLFVNRGVFNLTPKPPTATMTGTSLTPTLPVKFQAVAIEETTCYFGTNEGYNAFVPIHQFSIVSVLGKDSSGEWMLVRLEGFADCWIQSRVLQPQGDGNLLVITTILPPVKTPVATTVVVTVTTQLANQTPSANQTSYPPIQLAWKILSFECNSNGRATRALVDLNASGGVPPYRYSQKLPMYATPGQVVSIAVNSKTSDGEPSNIISFTIPRATDFKCDREGDNQVPPLPTSPALVPTKTPNPPPTLVPTKTPPACSDGQDNDNDGAIDYGNDPQCDSPSDTHEDS